MYQQPKEVLSFKTKRTVQSIVEGSRGVTREQNRYVHVRVKSVADRAVYPSRNGRATLHTLRAERWAFDFPPIAKKEILHALNTSKENYI